MRKILIISPHFPPSNLAAVHRSRLFANHLPNFGWQPIILSVHEKYYEEKPDWNLFKLLPHSLKVQKVKALPLTKPRMIGDIGLRAFFYLYNEAKRIIRVEEIDFIYIPIPSFYCSLLGRLLHAKTGVKYGIDYIDPWVHRFPGSDKIFSRHWFSTQLAKILEPIAIKNASLITGVAEGYYTGVIERNPKLKNIVVGAMPYGGERSDHQKAKEINLQPYLFSVKADKFQIVYAGAMLPKAYTVLEAIFSAIVQAAADFDSVEFHFIGTGKTAVDTTGYNIKPLAEKYKLWQTVVFEYPARIPYLDVLAHLEAAKGVLVIGSTEPHYTPSKIYQAILSGKPLFAVLHKQSAAVNMLLEAKAGLVLDFDGEAGLQQINERFVDVFKSYQSFANQYEPTDVNAVVFEKYSAEIITKQLATLLNAAVK